MKIAFFSETGDNQKYPRDFPNARTEVGWCLALDAPMCNLNNLPNERYDLGIIIIPKNNPIIDLDSIKKCCTKVAVMQEGPHWYFQDYTLNKQFNYFNLLMEVDWVYCHNQSDVNYYKGLGCKDVRVMRSLMITDGLYPRSEQNNLTMIGGNMVSWYGGFDSYIVGREIGNSMSAPSMGRRQEQENEIEDINYLPYMTWRDWVNHLSNYSIGVHLMRTHAAGTFAMNCGFHSIPCIGYEGLDTQELIHPMTTIKLGDLESAVNVGRKLKNDKDFYDECSKKVNKNFNKHYTEKSWLENWKNVNIF